jgi:RNA polymerase sigma-70 factor (ECF subfamily)
MRLEEIYAQYFRRVYTFVLSLSRNEHTAEEITQETFFRIMKNPEAFQGRSSIDTYLCSIAHNLYVSSLRKRKREAADPDWEGIPDDRDLEGILTDRDTAKRLHRMLHRLEEPYKEVFSLRVFGELPYQEIGALFEKGESWARVTYFRAKQKLQRMMEEDDHEG